MLRHGRLPERPHGAGGPVERKEERVAKDTDHANEVARSYNKTQWRFMSRPEAEAEISRPQPR